MEQDVCAFASLYTKGLMDDVNKLFSKPATAKSEDKDGIVHQVSKQFIERPHQNRPQRYRMMHQTCFSMPATTARALLTEGLRTLSPKTSGDGPPRRSAILDTFDGRVRKSGKVLLWTDGSLELWSEDQPPLHQPAVQRPRYVAELDTGSVKSALRSLPMMLALRTLGAGDLQHITLAFVDGVQKTRVRAKLWVLTTNHGGAAAIATVQGLRGYGKAVRQVQDHIRAHGGQSISTAALYSDLFPTHTGSPSKARGSIDQNATAFDATSTNIRTYLSDARHNELGIIADHDIQFLRSYRISLRKIRSLLNVFSGVYANQTAASLKERFAGLMSETGPLRDLDVFLSERGRFYTVLPDSLHSGLDRVFDLLMHRRTEAHRTLARALQSKEHAAERDALAKLFAKTKKLDKGLHADRSAQEYARALVWKKYKKLCKTSAALDEQTPDNEIHRLRIQCKRLRYLMELLGPAGSKSQFRPVLRPVRQLQDTLGRFNDCSVLHVRLHCYFDQLSASPDRAHSDTLRSIRALAIAVGDQQRDERKQVLSQCAAVNTAEAREAFAARFTTKGVAA